MGTICRDWACSKSLAPCWPRTCPGMFHGTETGVPRHPLAVATRRRRKCVAGGLFADVAVSCLSTVCLELPLLLHPARHPRHKALDSVLHVGCTRLPTR